MENEDQGKLSAPIWHSPVWITAIVGLISAFLTIPDIIGNYLTKQQDIELAKEKTEEARLGNVESKLDQEFKVVNSTLAQQGAERVFLLRYLAATLDDGDAKEWARGEVSRLDKLAELQKSLKLAQSKFDAKEKHLLEKVADGSRNKEELEIELDTLKLELENKKSVISELQKNAGIEDNQDPKYYTSVFLITNPAAAAKARFIISYNEARYPCAFEDYCHKVIKGIAPSVFEIVSTSGSLESFGGVFVSSFVGSGPIGIILDRVNVAIGDSLPKIDIPYDCKKNDNKITCIQSHEHFGDYTLR